MVRAGLLGDGLEGLLGVDASQEFPIQEFWGQVSGPHPRVTVEDVATPDGTETLKNVIELGSAQGAPAPPPTLQPSIPPCARTPAPLAPSSWPRARRRK